MADIALVDTSLHDGNQSLWELSAAIDFTTSTHMGVAVRCKREDPWKRIRLTAAATPCLPRFFMADPMNDAQSSVTCARMVRRGGGEFIIAAWVSTFSPIHDDELAQSRSNCIRTAPWGTASIDI